MTLDFLPLTINFFYPWTLDFWPSSSTLVPRPWTFDPRPLRFDPRDLSLVARPSTKTQTQSNFNNQQINGKLYQFVKNFSVNCTANWWDFLSVKPNKAKQCFLSMVISDQYLTILLRPDIVQIRKVPVLWKGRQLSKVCSYSVFFITFFVSSASVSHMYCKRRNSCFNFSALFKEMKWTLSHILS